MRTKSKEKMQRIVDFINESYFSNNGIPTIQEIAEHIGLSVSMTSYYLADMVENGMLIKDGTYYGFHTVKMQKAGKTNQYLPVVGEVACGTPTFAEENIESYVTLSKDILGVGEFFIVKAYGDSMVDAGINAGDYVIIRKQETAQDGQIVVARVDGGDCTLKRFYLDEEKQCVRLHPHNAKYEDMYFKHVDIQGVAVKVIKSLI